MPTVILLDLSLSMTRLLNIYGEDGERITIHQLSILGINALLDYLSSNCKLEFVSLVVFTTTYQQLVPFTRDYNEIKSALKTIKEWNKSIISVGLDGANNILMREWGFHTTGQIILVTDCKIGIGTNSLMQYENQRSVPKGKQSSLSKFPSKLLVACLSCPSTDKAHATYSAIYSQLIEVRGDITSDELFIPDKVLSAPSVRDMFTRLVKKHFVPFTTTLKCGHLRGPVSIFPPIQIESSIKEIDICGFLEGPDVSSPPFESRHLLLPVTDLVETEFPDRTPTFAVLLHGSFKVEGMVAIVQLSVNRYGMLYSYADSKKKSNLTLSVFKPGPCPVPWLGDIAKMGPSSELDTSPYLDGKSPFPVVSSDKKSYSQNCVVWIHNTGLQADIQKILRSARKLPEKQAQFYKELNRLRKAALAIGFFELFESLACLLERECTMLTNNAHPNSALQMTHAASILRSPLVYDINQAIQPLTIIS